MNTTFEILENYKNYLLSVLGRSELTVTNYSYDLIQFFRYFKKTKKLVSADIEFDEIELEDIDVRFLSSITYDDLLAYLVWEKNEMNCSASTRKKKIAALRSFFKFCCAKRKLLANNPTDELDTPKLEKRNPKHLTLEESKRLLNTAYNSPKATNARDYCMVTLFINCGLRVSELRDIDIDRIQKNTLSVIGKGNKERTVYLNEACLKALEEWLCLRYTIKANKEDEKALFISKQKKRISVDMVQLTIKRLLSEAGIDASAYSVHKLRHTAATLMYKYGNVDIRSLQKILGHESIATTQIYTHIDDEQLRDAVNSNPLSNFIPEE